MTKLQQYYVLKISTSRLKKSNYNLTLTINDARKSGELVSIGDSQMLRSLRKIKNIECDPIKIKELFLQRKKIKNKKYTPENSDLLLEIEKNIDDILFVPEIVSVLVTDIKQYEYLGQHGFLLNGRRFKRFLCGAGQARRNNSLWISEEYESQLTDILNNGRRDIEIVPAKFSAYFSLSASASLPISEPYFCVVPDKIIKRVERVDFIIETENGDDVVEERDEEIEFNLFDGQGLISPKFAKQVAENDLGLDYIPSAFIIRANFIKGMLCVADFHDFAENVAENHYIVDIWGNKVNIRDMDIILTESQFKLWNAYESMDDYLRNCKKNSLTWGVSRVTPKNENRHTFLNYQFIQALELTDQQIEKLAQKTLEYFENVTKEQIEFTLLYLLGKMSDQEFDPDIMDKIHDNVTKALIYNNDLLQDPYIKDYLVHSLNKKIRESYIGNLIVDGSYTMMIADPYAFMEYIFGKEPVGLLERNHHYSFYWLEKGEKQIVAMRAPLTWRSEVNVLNLKRNKDIDYWYKYLKNCVIYNVHGNDGLIHGGSDFDGDIVCVTSNKQILEGAMGGLPIHYATKKASKQIINNKELYKSDINGFNNRVGFVTNVATTAFAMLPTFEKDTPEYCEMIDRLKRFRKEQGSTIDATKGLVIKPFPMHWTKFSHAEDMEFENKLVINKRPYFMRWVYSQYNKSYSNYKNRFIKYTRFKFNKELPNVLCNPIGSEEVKFKCDYEKYTPLLETDCLMNNLSKFMENRVKQIKVELKCENIKEYNHILIDKDIPFDSEKYRQLDMLHRFYKKGKRNFSNILDLDGSRKYKTIEQYNKYIRQEAYKISSNGSELANLAVVICYREDNTNDNRSFVWQIFGNDIVKNIYKNRKEDCFVPFLDKGGNIEYLGEKYSMFKLNLKEEDGNDDYI